jgi:hypothetical protein
VNGFRDLFKKRIPYGDMSVEKYGIQRGGWCYEETQVPYGVGLWRNIRNGWGSFSNLVSYNVGDGSRLCF